MAHLISITTFSAALCFLFYVLFGYPLLLGWMARRPRPVRRGPFEPTVTLILAVHNGERFLEQKLRSILELDYPRDKVDIIVASDGSTDGTTAIASSFSRSGVHLLTLPRGGKPLALNAAIGEARGEILVFTDVRQLLAPNSLKLLLENFADPTVGGASGELVIRDGKTAEEADVGLYWRYEFWIRTRLSRIDSIFGATGAYYALRRRLAVPIPPRILLDDVYLPMAGFLQGYRLIVDRRARAFDSPASLRGEFRRKIRTLAGNYQILLSCPWILSRKNRMLFHYVSYKLARLLLPFALLGAAVSSVWLPAPWAAPALAAQVAFYAVAIADPLVPSGFPLKRVSSPIRTFVTLMIAALLALSVFFVPPEKLWRPGEAPKG
ncbi:MAG: glycosyltransferase family 2 protein [Bryobacterales bacterium]|nr:glycosyltransferase family 2 protein [Bryobacterales bacterium]